MTVSTGALYVFCATVLAYVLGYWRGTRQRSGDAVERGEYCRAAKAKGKP